MITSLAPAPDGGWSLDDFLSVVAEQMARLGLIGTPPDRRTVRYYATAGALDKPTQAGREARYHDRHLWQLLALKRLQGAGLRLAAIIDRLASADSGELLQLATDTAVDHAGPAPFWQQRPAARPHAPSPAIESNADESTWPAPALSSHPTLRRQTRLDLAPTVRLVIDEAELSPTEASAIAEAAAPLLSRLRTLGVDV